MFSFIRRHQSLTMVFMLLVIASFLLFFTDRSIFDGGGSSAGLGTIDGRPITRREYLNAQKEAMLAHLLQYGDWPKAGSFSEQMGWNTEQETMRLLMMASRLKAMNIEVGDEAVAKQVAQLFRGDGNGSVQDKYRNFVEARLKPQGISEEDFRRFLRHDLGKQQLGGYYSASGNLLTIATAEAAYRYENQRVETKAVLFSATNFVTKAKSEVDPKALTSYYSNQVAKYNLPTRVQVSYVAFEAINHLAEAAQAMAKNTNLNAIVEQIYRQRGSNAFTDEKGIILSAEKAKEKIRDEGRTEEATRIAQQQAYQFASELEEMKPVTLENLNALAGKKGLKVFETEPFANIDGPQGIKDSAGFSRQAFNLSREQPFGMEPVQAGDNFYVMGFKNRLPSVPQPFEVVKAKVEEDYIQYRASQLANEAGVAFANAVTNGMSAGKKFADIAKEQKAKVVAVSPFGRRPGSIPELEAAGVPAGQFSSAAFSRRAGEASGFIPSGGGGFVLMVEKILPADEAKMKLEFKEYLDNLRSRQAGVAYTEWMNSQIQSAGVAVPGEN